MTLRTLAILTLALITSSCSLLGTRNIEISSKPIEIEIIQPVLPRPIEMTAPIWYVVSEAEITNPCRKVVGEDGKEKRPKACAYEDTENPTWPTDYTYLDQFLDEMKEQNGGEVVFVATTIGDYETMSMNMQEIKRYIKQLGQVVVYYRDVTIKTPQGDEKGVGVKFEKKD